jgi:hypothetical protein
VGADDRRRGGLTLSQVNKVHHVHTIARVGEDEDWLRGRACRRIDARLSSCLPRRNGADTSVLEYAERGWMCCSRVHEAQAIVGVGAHPDNRGALEISARGDARSLRIDSR